MTKIKRRYAPYNFTNENTGFFSAHSRKKATGRTGLMNYMKKRRHTVKTVWPVRPPPPPHSIASAYPSTGTKSVFNLWSNGIVWETEFGKTVGKGNSNIGTDEWTKLAKENGYKVYVNCVNHRRYRNDFCRSIMKPDTI